MSEFDQFRGRYSEHLDQMLAPLGSSAEEFARAKARLLGELARSHVGPPERLKILDMGCGPGNVTRHLEGTFGEVVGADVAHELLVEARNRAPRSTFVALAPDRVELEDDRFDLVFCAGVLHHIKDPDLPRFCQELARITRPGGLVVAFEHNPYNPVTRHIVKRCELDRDVDRLLPIGQTRRLFASAGLESVEERYIAFFPGRLSKLAGCEGYLRKLPLGGQYLLAARKPDPPSPAGNQPDLSLILPMYNEQSNVEPVSVALMDALRGAGIDFELLLVDNGSRDDTRAMILELAARHPEVRLVSVFPNRGYGWGVLNGMRQAVGKAVGWMGGDGQIEPADVVRTYQRFAAGDVALAKVNRVKRGDGPQRLVVTTIFNRMFRTLFGLSLPDINGTPKIVRRDLLEQLEVKSRDWFLDAEVMLKVACRGGEIADIPITFQPRLAGRSNVRLRTLWEFLVNIGVYWLRFWNARIRGREPFR